MTQTMPKDQWDLEKKLRLHSCQSKCVLAYTYAPLIDNTGQRSVVTCQETTGTWTGSKVQHFSRQNCVGIRKHARPGCDKVIYTKAELQMQDHQEDASQADISAEDVAMSCIATRACCLPVWVSCSHGIVMV